MSYQSPRRTRIVVPVGAQDDAEAAAPPPQQPGSSPRRPLLRAIGGFASLVGILALLAVIGGLLWWQQHTRSPAYSLALAVDAAARNDTAVFNQLVDTESIARRLAPQVAAQNFRLDEMPPDLQRQINDSLPQIMSGARGVITHEVQRTLAQFSPSAQLPVPLLALLIPRFAAINETGDEATAQVTVSDNHISQLAFTRDATNAARWRITGITDETLAAFVAAQIAKRPAAIAPAVPAPAILAAPPPPPLSR